jgi:hypothetical protein
LLKSSSLSSSEDNCFESLTDLIKNQEKNVSQTKQNPNDQEKDYQQMSQRQTDFNFLSEQEQRLMGVAAPSFHYSSSNNQNSFIQSNYSPSKQISEYIYPSAIQSDNLYQTLPNSSAANAAAAIFQAYSQFNARPTIINQQTIRK